MKIENDDNADVEIHIIVNEGDDPEDYEEDEPSNQPGCLFRLFQVTFGVIIWAFFMVWLFGIG